ncbi:hypothetical protein GOV07_00015 [Candidatus Woesearchaeota archaeon]|nr:hypothetical protein [Candidatus Woesearchaeota archaeon]
MDLNRLNQQVNEALNRWWAATVAYFSDLNQMEQYGWGAFGFGFVLFIVGLFVL